MLFEIARGLISPILLYVIGSYFQDLLECRKYPPGVIPMPFIGNLHLLGAEPHKTLSLYSKTYGNVFSISFGMQRIVVITDITATREALVQKATIFAGRPKSYITQLATRGYKDIVFMDYGSLWKVLRKVGHSSLKIYGEGFGRFEKLLTKESEELHKRILNKSNNPMELKTEFGGCSYTSRKTLGRSYIFLKMLLDINEISDVVAQMLIQERKKADDLTQKCAAILNVICFIVFGERYQYSDPEFNKIFTTINDIAAGMSNTAAIDFLPGLRYLQFSDIKKLNNSLSTFFGFLNEQLEKHKKKFDENNIRDFTDSIIMFSKDVTREKKFEEELTDEHLKHVMGDMFAAGSETTLTSLLWLVLYMIHYPKYQEEIFKEITTVIGENRYPSLNDRDSLHLVKASLKESLRLSSIAPLGVPHKTMRETTLMGHSIPNNTTVIINHWQINNDTNHWTNPNVFNPYRWFDEDNKFDASRATSYLPFSAGTRVCLGKTVAETELFFFFTRLIRDFKFECPPGCPLPSLIGKCSITLAPKPFKVYLTPRINNLM